MTFGMAVRRSRMTAMLWRLRARWQRADKTALVLAGFFFLVLGALLAALNAVYAYRDAQAARARDLQERSLECLARNVYYEARGESLAGQYAVAEVTMNRKATLGYPKTVCEVVYQKEAFSWTGMSELPPPAGASWQRATKVAHDVYFRRHASTVEGALHYHATNVRPDWSGEREKIARIGRHVFYR